MSWLKITYVADETGPINTANILNLVMARKAEAGSPSGFAVYKTTISNWLGRNPRTVIYLSPVAASLCEPTLTGFSPKPCNPPNIKTLERLSGNLP